MKRAISILFLIALTISVQAQRFTRVINTISELIASNPNNVDTNILVLSYATLTDDGGGPFAWYKGDASTPDGGTIFACTYPGANGRFKRLFSGALNVKWFNARGGGVNDTVAIKKAYDAIGATNAGDLFFPAQFNPYVFNLVVTNDNRGLTSDLWNDTRTGLESFRPADVTKPVVQVGNDTGYVYGFHMRNISINATTAPSALYLFGGPIECGIDNCSFYNGVNTVFMEGGSNYPVTLINFNNCNFWEGSNATIYCLRPVAVNGYVTGIYISGGSHINGNNNTGFAVRLDRTILSTVNSYFDLNDNHAVWISNGGKFRGFNVELEAIPTGVGLVTVSDESVHDPSRFLEGNITATGTIIYADSTSDIIPTQLYNVENRGYSKSPFLNDVHIVATGAPFATNNHIESMSGIGPLRITSGGNNLDVIPGLNLISASGTNYGFISDNSASGGLYFGSAGANQGMRFVPSGTGILEFHGPELHFGILDILSDLHIWGGLGSRAGKLTSASIDGGLSLQAEGTNQNVRLDPTGTGYVDVHGPIHFNAGSTISSGLGSPEGSVVGSPGDAWLRSGSIGATTIYVKDSGTNNTGWVTIGSGGSGGSTNYVWNSNQFTILGGTNVNLSNPVILTNLINPGFYRSGVTNVTGTSAVYSFEGSGTMNFTATGNSTITIADAQTSTNVAQIGQIHFVNNGTNTLTFAGQTNGMSVKRGTLSNPPLAGDTIYMMEQNGTNIWIYVDQVFLGTELPIDPGVNIAFATNGTTKRITISSNIGSSINPTDTFVPYRTNATSLADSLLSVDGVNRMSMSYRAADQFGPTLNFLKQGRTGSATNSPSSGAQLGTIGFGAWNGSADVYYQAIQAITTNWVVGTNTMRLDFYTASGASAILALRIAEDRKINIPQLTPNTYVGVDGIGNLVSTNAAAVFTTGAWVTNQAGVLSGNIVAGANITFTTNANGNVTIAAASGSSGARSFQAIGTGSDFNYSIGQAIYQKIAFGTSGPSFVLTNAGTYQVLLNVATYDAGTAYQDFFITNVTDHVLVPGTSQGINVSSSQVVMPILFQITTSGSNKSFELWGQTQNMTYLTAGVTAASTVLDIIALSSGSIGNQLYQGAGAPVSNPTDTTTTNFYYDTTSQITYVWNIVGAVWE